VQVLFDQGTPVPLRALLPDHDVATAYDRGWSTLTNGEFLDAAESAGFAAVVTTDKNIRHQQNIEEGCSESWYCPRRTGPKSAAMRRKWPTPWTN